MAVDVLFVYGTLMQGFGLHGLLEGRARYMATGTVHGRLLDLGAYPGATPDPYGTICGEVYRIVAPELMTMLDSTEGAQYHRGETRTRLEDGREATTFIYWYVGLLSRGTPIPGGDYRRHAPARSIHRHPNTQRLD